MSLLDIINGIDDRFVLREVDETFAVAYEKEGKDLSRNVKANSESAARNKFKDMMDADGQDSSDYRIKGVYKSATVDEDMDENMTTSNLDGGEGQPRISKAFQNTTPSKKDKKKEKNNSTKSTGYEVAAKTTNYIKRRDEMFTRASELIDNVDGLSEGRYTDYKSDGSTSAKHKINTSIMEVNKRLHEIERTINHAVRLKTETGMEDVFWKSTRGRFSKISEKMLRIGNKLREFNK